MAGPTSHSLTCISFTNLAGLLTLWTFEGERLTCCILCMCYDSLHMDILVLGSVHYRGTGRGVQMALAVVAEGQ